MQCSRIAFYAGMLCLAGSLAIAQEYRGRVQGSVMDASNAVVPGATVILKNVDTGVEATRSTSEAGRYIFDYVDPGTYSLAAYSKRCRSAFRTDGDHDSKLMPITIPK